MDVDTRRLTQPLVRADDGELRPAAWDVALDRVARAFAELKARHGPDAFGCYSCSKSTNELNFLAQKFARAVIGTNNVDSCNRT
jgi:formate dehydrogenase major subunit